MKGSNNVKLVVFVPITHADIVRKALGDAGAGVIGDYRYCSFSSVGFGRYIGGEGTNPAVGKSGVYESSEEERIETLVSKDILRSVIDALHAVHPYEEVAFDIIPLLDYE